MRRLTSFALAALLATALGVSASALEFKAASGTATIDGVMDDCYLAAEEIAVKYQSSGTTGDGKTFASAYCVWDADNIYVLFDVTDPVLSEYHHTTTFWYSDSVEFFLDLTNTNDGTDITTINAGQYTAAADLPGKDNTIWNGRGGHWDANVANAKWESKKTDKGYITEMQIPWGADYTPKAGAKIGCVFHINSDEDGVVETREGEYFANPDLDQSQAWSTVANYDTLVLTDAVYVPPVEESATTADAGVIAALAALASTGAAALSLKKRK